MLTLINIRPYLDSTIVDLSKTTQLTALTQAASDYVSQYTNLTIDEDSPQGLIKAVADIVTFSYAHRNDVKSLKSEDMQVTYTAILPRNIVHVLNQYRRLRW